MSVPRRRGIEGNDAADILSEEGAELEYIGPRTLLRNT